MSEEHPQRPIPTDASKDVNLLRQPHKVATCEHGISVHIPCKRCKDNYDAAFKIDKEEAEEEKEATEDWT